MKKDVPELKIKEKHLAEEAKIIRREENKYLGSSRWHRERQLTTDANDLVGTYKHLRDHRVWDVRNERRATVLARAYLNGRTYKEVEQKRQEDKEYRFTVNIIPRVVSMVNKYGPMGIEVDRAKILEWSKLSD